MDYSTWHRTVHAETVVLLSQQKADDHIEVDLDLDDLVEFLIRNDKITSDEKTNLEESLQVIST